MDFLYRIIGAMVVGLLGWRLGSEIEGVANLTSINTPLTIAAIVVGSLAGFLVAAPLSVRFFHWLMQQVRRVPAHDLVSGLIGLFMGLLLSVLLAVPLSLLPGLLGKLAPFVVSVVLGILGIGIMVTRQTDFFEAVRSLGHIPVGREGRSHGASRIVVDTSAIIDGRIADISHTGFVQGTLVIPRFVLVELQKIADSSDSLRRNRGRRGLEVLNKLQKESVIPIEIIEGDADDRGDVDGRLVKMAKKLRALIITSDYNLNRVAEIQGVTVLNINELANALRAVVMPGEEMSIRIIQEGKEQNQGVGYLDHGTMVVVEGGKRFINSQVDVVVTRVLQTVAGRMIFGQPRSSHN
ncbi:MAG: PIN domain nuclease [Dehalococcoidia bacterium]|nr:PIN domain nuclease [Dehalococcoidia bacterium]